MAGTIVAGTLSDGTYSGSVTDTVRGACKAWVNFNGTGTVAIRAAYNVSSITDNGTGDYTVNFTTAMPDANYSWSLSCQNFSGGDGAIVVLAAKNSTTPTISALRIGALASSIGVIDIPQVTVSIFR